MEAVMTYAQAFFGWLLQTTLIASLVICLILLIQRILGNKLGPRWCHALWLVLLIRMVLPWSPSSRVSLSNLIPSWRGRTQSQQSYGSVEVQEISPPKQAAGTPETITSQEPRTELANEKQFTPKPQIVANAEDQSGSRLVLLRRILLILWMAGVIVIGVYLLFSDLALWRIVKRDRPLVNQAMLELFEECKAQMSVQSLVVVVPSDRVRSPGLFGFVRPRLLLPRQMLDTATTAEMRYVFLHELAHLRRHDIYLGWLTSLLQVLHWFNPLVWFAFYRMRADRELACDALVLTRTGQDKSQEYGGAIVELVRRFSRCRPLPAMAGIIESKSQLKRRIAMITQFKNKSYRFSPLAVVLIVILASVSLPDAISMQTSEISAKESAPPISLRRIWAGSDVDGSGEPSPDGKYLSFVDWETGDLAIYEIATGNKRRLTDKGTWDKSNEFALFSRWSPDGKQIVYDWRADNESQLRVVGIDGSKPRVLYRDDEVKWIETYDWSPDGKHILAWFQRNDGTTQIVLVSVGNGSVRILKTHNFKWIRNMCFSPDSRYIAYSYRQKEDSLNLDISVIQVDGDREISAIQHPAHDFVLGWAPDGKNILFASDRTGTQGAWLIGVEDGETQGDPELIRTDIGRLGPLGLTKDGSFYYTVSRGSDNVYVATLDQQTGKILTPQKKVIERHQGSNVAAAYSPDGKYLAYIYQLGFVAHNRGRQNILCIRSLETGKEREFPVNLNFVTRSSSPRWSPDGCSIIVTGIENNGYVANKVNIQNGEVKTVVKSHSCEWANDGKTVLYIQRAAQEKKVKILLRNLETGIEDEVYQSSDEGSYPYNMSVSPDGQWLAVRCNRPTSLKILPVAGGRPRELPEFRKAASNHKPIAWSADSQYVLFSGKEPSGGKHPLYRISIKDGKIERLGLRMNSYYGLSTHPDSRRILVSGRESAPESEVWVMENFLPEAVAMSK